MIQYPITFETKTVSDAAMRSTWEVSSGEQTTTCCIPPEFAGPGGGFSPEDLFAQALTNCFLATFKVICENSKVTVAQVEVAGRLTVDKNESRQPVMKAFHFTIRLHGASHPDRAKSIAKKAIESGFILNSVKTVVTYNIE